MGKNAQDRLNWGDLQFVLAVMRQGTVAEAAKSLGVNRTTVLRRISHLEEFLDFQIFDRHGSQYVLAPGSNELLQGALAVEKTIDDLRRQILGKEIQLAGTITVTTTDSILISTLAPHIASFRTRHPQIRIELVVSNHQLSLSRRDADVAIRPGLVLPEHLSGRMIGPMYFGIFASSAIEPGDWTHALNDLPWLGMDSPLLESPPGRWLESNVSEDRIVCRVDSFVALRALAETGLGISVLPTALGRMSPLLRQIHHGKPEVENKLWVVSHPDLERSTRVSALINHLVKTIVPETGPDRPQ